MKGIHCCGAKSPCLNKHQSRFMLQGYCKIRVAHQCARWRKYIKEIWVGVFFHQISEHAHHSSSSAVALLVTLSPMESWQQGKHKITTQIASLEIYPDVNPNQIHLYLLMTMKQMRFQAMLRCMSYAPALQKMYSRKIDAIFVSSDGNCSTSLRPHP